MLFSINESSLASSQQTERVSLQFAIVATTGCALFTWNGNTPTPRLLAEGGKGSAMTILTQAAIDALLGSTNEIISATAFDTTNMADNNSMAVVLDCKGQVAHVAGVQAFVNIAGTCGVKNGNGTKTVPPATTAPVGITAYVTALGNICLRMTYTNVSAAASAGHVCITMDVKFK
jgi:hypothetical protein